MKKRATMEMTNTLAGGAAMDFKREENRIYAEDEGGKLIAEILFPRVADNVVDICHTFVDSSLRGQGIADKLVRAVIAEVQPKGCKVRTSCPYAEAWFSSHPEYADLTEE